MSELNALKERREHRRDLCSELVEIGFEEQQGSTVTSTGLLEDVSVEGLCISMSLPLSVGARVRVRADGFDGRAQVRRCEVREDDFLVALQLDPSSKWDPVAWKPAHLLKIPLGRT